MGRQTDGLNPVPAAVQRRIEGMKRNTQVVLVGFVLLALAALSSVKRGAAPTNAGNNSGACCPLIQSPDQMSLATGTNAPVLNVPTNKEPLTQHL